MPRPVLLERFGFDAPGLADEAPGAAPDVADPCAAAEPSPPADDPPADPDAERRECLSRIAAALEAVAADQAALREQWRADAAAALGAAAAEVVPRLARAGLAAHVAELAARLGRDGRWPHLALHAAPGDAGEIGEAIRTAGPQTLEIVPDPGLAPGSVRLSWKDGGAEIDAEAIAATALERLRRALAPDRQAEPER